MWFSRYTHPLSRQIMSTFKRHLKSHLFQSALPPSHPVSAPQIRSTILALYKLVCMYVCMYVSCDSCWQCRARLRVKMAEHATHQRAFATVPMSSTVTPVNTVLTSLCSVGSRPSDHYFRSVCLFVCLCRVFLSRL